MELSSSGVTTTSDGTLRVVARVVVCGNGVAVALVELAVLPDTVALVVVLLRLLVVLLDRDVVVARLRADELLRVLLVEGVFAIVSSLNCSPRP
ncbi:hypothetical protein [Shimia isoporae]|uniref:hypothetical protein n=1 Tax=Shimia isoporae TaxID=647720 RepID=UPI001046A2CD|nr:hypothetical protein [Shimia isoporae]